MTRMQASRLISAHIIEALTGTCAQLLLDRVTPEDRPELESAIARAIAHHTPRKQVVTKSLLDGKETI